MIRGRSKWLAQVINERGYKRGAEVGAAIGLTTRHVLSNCESIEMYIVVDDWRQAATSGVFASPRMKETFMDAVGRNRKLKILEGLSWEQAGKVTDRSLDFVFIDASHDYESVKKDLLAWEPKVKIGGLLSGHDVNWKGVQKALKELHPDYTELGINEVWFKYLK